MFNFMKKTSSTGIAATIVDKEEKERRKKEKKERKEREKRERGNHSGEDILRIDEVRRSLKLRRKKDKEKLPSGITADYSANFFTDIDREQLKDELIEEGIGGAGGTGSGTGGSVYNRIIKSDTLQSDSSENSLSSISLLSTATTATIGAATTTSSSKVLPPLPPRPPKRGILKGPKVNLLNEDCTDDTNIVLQNTIQNELITYSNLPNKSLSNHNNNNNNNKYITKMFINNESSNNRNHNNETSNRNHNNEALNKNHNEKSFPSSATIKITTPLIKTSSPPNYSSIESLTTEDSCSFLTPPFSTSPIGEGQGFNSKFFLSTTIIKNNNSNNNDLSSNEDINSSTNSNSTPLLQDLPLPNIKPIILPQPRDLIINRNVTRNDFGFSLRRSMIIERNNGCYNLKPVIFAEPGPIIQHQNETGLLPGDRLIQVNGINVDNKTREEIIELIKNSENSVTVRVQPVPELCELSRRSGTDGTPVELDDNYIKSGTLRRSGSLRFKNSRAKSEEQLANEKSWLDAEKLWLLHRGGFTSVRRLSPIQDGKLKVKVETSGVELVVDEDDIEKCNPDQYDVCEDLCQLRNLNESSILHTLRSRYGSNLIHTYAGPTTIIINPVAPLAIYSDKVAYMFKGCSTEDMPAHIYSTAQSLYRSIQTTRRDHSLLFLGRSGSGKTINYNHALQYLTLTAGSVNKILTIEKLNAIMVLLDSFGNAKTSLNLNATRFSHIFSLDFDQSGLIASGSIQLLLLEKSRVVRRPEGEGNFHIMYRLLAGADGILRKDLMLDSITNSTEQNQFITPYSKHEDKQKALMEFVRVCTAMKSLGISETEMKCLFSMLSAVLHLGAAGAIKVTNSNKWQFNAPGAAQKASKCLGITLEQLSRTIFQNTSSNTLNSPSNTVRSYRNSNNTSSANEDTIPNGQDSLEYFASNLYLEVFNTIGALINRSLTGISHTVCSLLLIDCPGFQNPASTGQIQCGANFNDFCYNYIQERLNLLFHYNTLIAPKDLYSQEHIDINSEDIDDMSPETLVNLYDSSGTQWTSSTTSSESRKPGLLWLLDEHNSNQNFSDLIFNVFSEKEYHGILRKAPGHNHFIVQHSLGTNPVLYNTENWLKISKEQSMSRQVVTLLQESNNKDLSTLISTYRSSGLGSSALSSNMVIGDSQSLRRVSSIRRTTSNFKRKSLTLQVKFTVDSLIETVRRTKIKFVHCMIPHHNAGLIDTRSTSTSTPQFDSLINIPLLRSQLRGAQILPAVRLYKQGYPKCMPLQEFRRRFRLLGSTTSSTPQSPNTNSSTSSISDDKNAVEEILLSLDLDHSSYRVGLSQIFFRSNVLPQLESQRDEKLSSHIVQFQSICRGYLARKHFSKLKVQDVAVRCIQRNVQKFMDVRDWAWWRLLIKINPLLNVHRTEQELQTKSEELEALKLKFEKLETERNILKQDNTRLESKLNEITEDYADEHSTATVATERLALEAAERSRLEKELSDTQTQNKKLHENSEKLELEVLCLRTTDVNGDDNFGDEINGGGGDIDVLKKRYERVCKELAFTKQRLTQQHQDDLEQLIGLRKQLEKKLSDAYEEVEEQRHVASEWKRKVQKLNSEMNDIRMLLEEQSSRNNLLEKKQRKFDSEYQMIQDELRQERLNKEKALRDKELAIGDKYTMEQNLSSLKLELELKEQKVVNLNREIEELTFSGNTEEEVANLKKKKHQLEAKLKDQEEELDDLAGQIQMLEQSKLKVEMNLEQIRKAHRKELSQKDEEIEELRCSSMKKLKALENQLENEHEERTLLLRERHELERRLSDLDDKDRSTRQSDIEQFNRLKRDLKRTKALLKDTQTQLEQSRQDNPNKLLLRQLRNQLEDSECARNIAIKTKQSAENDLIEANTLLDEIQKNKREIEEKLSNITREKNQLQTQLDENEEELVEVLKKYQTSVQQLSLEQINLQEQTTKISELEQENNLIKEQLNELNSKLETIETHGDPSSTLALKRIQLKCKELESKLEFEHTTRSRLEVQINRLKENTEKLQSECNILRNKENTSTNEMRKLQRTIRELKESIQLHETKEINDNMKRKELEKNIETSETEVSTLKNDLKLALQRISDLQNAIQGDLDDEDDDSDDNSDNSDNSLSSDDDDDDDDERLTAHDDGYSSKEPVALS